MTQRTIKGVVIAGVKSGSGKTTVMLGLLAALCRRGFTLAPFKVGPDFIDPGHHRAITGVQSHNLDGWMLSRSYNLECFGNHARNADIAVVEGVMGLFDGYDGKSEAGSTAQMVKWLNLPVLLVVDARSMARSAAALVQGFERFDPDLNFAGVLFNNIGSPRHLEYLQEALDGNVRMPCLGGLSRQDALGMPERHLGLVTSEEHRLTPAFTNAVADLIENGMDLEGLIQGLPEIDFNKTASRIPKGGFPDPIAEPRVKIGVARDRAFCFYYPDNLAFLEAFGAELIAFSPIDDRRPPPDLDGLYLGGGYPEMAAEALSRNGSMRQAISAMSRQGMPIYSECGGFMYLCRAIYDMRGNRFFMVGCFPFETQMSNKLSALGYREITLLKDTLIGKAGQKLRGHEFHYSHIGENALNGESKTVYQASPRTGVQKSAEGYLIRRTLGSYIHLHFGSCPSAAANFVKHCATYQHERNAHL